MSGILIRIKPGHTMNGEGEKLGADATGQSHTFWRSSGNMEIPLDLAMRLERERPQRFEIVDRVMAKNLLGIDVAPVEEPSKPVPEPELKLGLSIGLAALKKMKKDEINDWAAKRDYDVNPSKQNKTVMILELIKQIEKRTGKKVK